MNTTELELDVIHDKRRRRGRPTTIDCDTQDRIIELRLRGYSFQEIADHLNRHGIPTPHGGTEWRPSGLQKTLARLRTLYPNLK